MFKACGILKLQYPHLKCHHCSSQWWAPKLLWNIIWIKINPSIDIKEAPSAVYLFSWKIIQEINFFHTLSVWVIEACNVTWHAWWITFAVIWFRASDWQLVISITTCCLTRNGQLSWTASSVRTDTGGKEFLPCYILWWGFRGKEEDVILSKI